MRKENQEGRKRISQREQRQRIPAPIPTPEELKKKGYTMHLHEVTDYMDLLSPSAWMIVCCVLRNTAGYQEYAPRHIKGDEFQFGRKRKDGTRIDHGTGLYPQQILAAIEDAILAGVLYEEVDTRDKARIQKSYAVIAPWNPCQGVYRNAQGELEIHLIGGIYHPSEAVYVNHRPDSTQHAPQIYENHLAGYEVHTSGVGNSYPGSMKIIERSEKETLERTLEINKEKERASLVSSETLEDETRLPETITLQASTVQQEPTYQYANDKKAGPQRLSLSSEQPQITSEQAQAEVQRLDHLVKELRVRRSDASTEEQHALVHGGHHRALKAYQEADAVYQEALAALEQARGVLAGLDVPLPLSPEEIHQQERVDALEKELATWKNHQMVWETAGKKYGWKNVAGHTPEEVAAHIARLEQEKQALEHPEPPQGRIQESQAVYSAKSA